MKIEVSEYWFYDTRLIYYEFSLLMVLPNGCSGTKLRGEVGAFFCPLGKMLGNIRFGAIAEGQRNDSFHCHLTAQDVFNLDLHRIGFRVYIITNLGSAI